MTVTNSTARGDYNCNGSTQAFSIPFQFFLNTEVQVLKTDTTVSPAVVTTLALTTDYTVSGGAGSTGTFTTVATFPTGIKLSVLPNLPFTQQAHYVPNDPFPAETHEQALDRLDMQDIQLNEKLGRAAVLPPTVSGVNPALPVPVANAALVWDPTGTFLTNGASAGLAVASFNGRTGVVVPASGDYAVNQITGAAPSASPTFTGTATAPTFTATTQFTGPGTGLTGTAASLTAGTVTTNANLTGDVTSSGNVTTLAATQPGAHTWSQVQNISNTTASTSPTTGALVVAGGVGVAGQLSGALCVFGTGALLGNATLTYNQMLTLQSSSGSAWKFGTTDIGGSALNITCDFGSFTINKTTGNVGTPGSFVATTSFIGPGTGLTGTAASLTAGTATAANGLNSATTTVSVSAATAPTNGQVLTATSGTAATWQTPAGGSTSHLTRTVFTSSGSWTCPTGVTYADVTLLGGGGAGGDGDGTTTGGGGGGAGATNKERIPVTAGTQYDIVIGAGGTFVAGASGNPGGDTTFAVHLGATLMTSKGGSGGVYGGTSGAGGPSGAADPQLGGASGVLAATAAGANSATYAIALRSGFFIPGGGGGQGGNASVGPVPGGKCESYNGGTISGVKYGGNGGASPFGPGGSGANSAVNATAPAANTGAGGGGGSVTTTPRLGAAGASGYAIIDAVY